MKVSYNWLKEYVKNLPKPEKLADLLTMYSFETEVIDNNILDVDVLPNRAHDCLGHLGIAREIATITGGKIRTTKYELREVSQKTEDLVSIEVKDTELCPRYTARVITDIKVGPSPKWLRERLEAVGQQAINNIVDATNYVALEIGQPLHAFDFEKVGGKKIIIRRAKKGEKITTLDGEKRELDNDILVIADSKDPIAIAGIKGGKKAEIDKNTKTIILESANFNLHNIHRSSRKLSIATESSLRFEHGLDPNLASEAIDRLAALIQKIAGGKIAKGMIDVYPNKVVPRKISLIVSKINSVLGVEISIKEAVGILNSLGFEVETNSAIEKVVKKARDLIGKPYKFGADLKHAPHGFNCSSLIRYVYRQMGLGLPRDAIEQIEVGTRVSKKYLQPGDLIFSKGSAVPRRSKKWPSGVGHVGIYVGKGKVIHASQMTMKVKETDLEEFSDWRGACRLLEEKDCLLTVKIPTRRLDIEISEDLIEEIGRIYGYEKISSKPPTGLLSSVKPDDLLRLRNKAKDILEGLGLTEVYNYSFVGEGDLELENPLSLDLKYLRRDLIPGLLKNIRDNFRFFEEVRLFELGKVYLKNEKMMLAGALGRKIGSGELFYEAKGMIDVLLNKLGITEQWSSDKIKIGNKEIGFIEKADPRVVVFNIDFESLVKLVSEELIYQHPSKYPAVVRDIAILVNRGDRVADVLNVINSVGGELVIDVDLFDMYEGGEIPENKKNLAFHIVYQSDKRTLTDKEVDKVHSGIIREVSKKNGWEIRK